MNAARVIVVSLLAGVLGALLGQIASAGDVSRSMIFLSYFTLLGSLGFLAPAYAVMQFAGVPMLRRYVGVSAVGVLAGAVVLVPLDVASGNLEAAPLGAMYGGITAACWVVLHSATQWTTRKSAGR